MADKKKMSVEEMLAAARAEKSGGATPAKAAAPKAESSPEVAAEISAPEVSATPAPAKPVAKGGKGMSVADMLAAARGEKSGAKRLLQRQKSLSQHPKRWQSQQRNLLLRKRLWKNLQVRW